MSVQTARALLRHCEGWFVGALNEEELEAFELLCREGAAYRSYEGAAGLMGLAKVRIRR